MLYFTSPSSFRNSNAHYSNGDSSILPNIHPHLRYPQVSMSPAYSEILPPHSSHPNFSHLTLLVFEAVLEVVCVSLPGYILARQGLFSEDMQKFVAYLNILLFTPCLIFTKLASQLTADKLADLAVIPLIYAVQVGVSYLCSLIIAKAFGFSKRPRNFVIAMGVFANSNSLPISLVLSLSRTIRGLHWDKLPGDNDDEVGARGILYLLIFQQLGQLLRWSWGINVLLKKPAAEDLADESVGSRLERGNKLSSDPTVDGYQPLSTDTANASDDNHHPAEASGAESSIVVRQQMQSEGIISNSRSENEFNSGEQTPITEQQYTSSISSKASFGGNPRHHKLYDGLLATPANGNIMPPAPTVDVGKSSPSIANTDDGQVHRQSQWSMMAYWRRSSKESLKTIINMCQLVFYRILRILPPVVQKGLANINTTLRKILRAILNSLNPPLLAMGAALIVASIPALQNIFFRDGTFVKNSITSAIRQSGGVAVPLILVVLGANLARGSQRERPDKCPMEDSKEETRLLIASLLSRMVLPTIVMAPLLAITAKYIPISILDDPIFVIVCFLLAGAPSALQLAQICQLNEVYMGAMTKILFHSYVVWILPSTLILVMCALEVVEWSATS